MPIYALTKREVALLTGSAVIGRVIPSDGTNDLVNNQRIAFYPAANNSGTPSDTTIYNATQPVSVIGIGGWGQGNLALPVRLAGTYGNITTNTTTTLKSAAGTLHSIVVNNPGSAETVTVYDNTAGSGTTIATLSLGTMAPDTILYGVVFNTGLTIVTAGTTACNITVNYS
jgi:hypothetical protein